MSRNTVYVVGAGASRELNLPIGNELKKDISETLYMKFEYGSFAKGNYDLFKTINRHTENDNEELNRYLKECSHIRDNMPLAISIDNFIDSERGNNRLALCGKMAIVETILRAERLSKIFFSPDQRNSGINFSILENTWYLPFFRTITENCRVEDLQERFEAITLIIFNYDRCVEHFLINALISYYRLNETNAATIVNSLKIIHPYGTVGALVWQDQSSPTCKYGEEVQNVQLIKYAQRIRTFTEGAHSEQMELINHGMKNAERLVFLGFAFHRLNMELLMKNSNEQYNNLASIDCFATAFETSKNDQESIAASIKYLYRGIININIENTTCAQLFRNNSRSLGYD